MSHFLPGFGPDNSNPIAVPAQQPNCRSLVVKHLEHILVIHEANLDSAQLCGCTILVGYDDESDSRNIVHYNAMISDQRRS